MANSTAITDYLGQGLLSARPTTPPVATTVLSIYYATDKEQTYQYDWVLGAWVTLGGNNFRFGFFIGGVPTSSQLLFSWKFTDAVKFPTNLTGGEFSIAVNPTSSFTLTLNKNGSSIGTVVFSTAGAPTVTVTATSFAIADVFTVVAPGTVDATASGINFAIKAQYA